MCPREVVRAHVDVDDELVAGQGPAILGPRDQRDQAGIDDGDLCSRVGTAVGGPRAAAGVPAVADESGNHIQRALCHDFTLINVGSLDDHAQGSAVSRRLPNVVKPGLQLVDGWLPFRVH